MATLTGGSVTLELTARELHVIVTALHTYGTYEYDLEADVRALLADLAAARA